MAKHIPCEVCEDYPEHVRGDYPRKQLPMAVNDCEIPDAGTWFKLCDPCTETFESLGFWRRNLLPVSREEVENIINRILQPEGMTQ